jgi:hypothetical protein
VNDSPAEAGSPDCGTPEATESLIPSYAEVASIPRWTAAETTQLWQAWFAPSCSHPVEQLRDILGDALLALVTSASIHLDDYAAGLVARDLRALKERIG